MHESYVNVNGGQLYVRHTEIDQTKKTVLFLHGLGESGLSFSEAFEEFDPDDYNIVVPDLLGYGRSSAANGDDYSFEAQLERIWQLANQDKEWAEKWDSCRRYYAALWFCRPEAFMANAIELDKRNPHVEGKRECEAGARFRRLSVKKVFCWGDESLAAPTKEFLTAVNFTDQPFLGAFHWPMIDCREEFYTFLREFLSGA